MAKCPNCEAKLAYFDFIGLNKRETVFRCSDCKKILEVDISSIEALSGLFIFFGSFIWLFNYISKTIFFYGFIISVFLLSIGSVLIIRSAKVRIAVDQDQVLESDGFDKKYEKPDLPKNPTRLDRLKYQYYDKSEKELYYILSNKKMISEAHEAARIVLKERYNAEV